MPGRSRPPSPRSRTAIPRAFSTSCAPRRSRWRRSPSRPPPSRAPIRAPSGAASPPCSGTSGTPSPACSANKGLSSPPVLPAGGDDSTECHRDEMDRAAPAVPAVKTGAPLPAKWIPFDEWPPLGCFFFVIPLSSPERPRRSAPAPAPRCPAPGDVLAMPHSRSVKCL